MQPSFAKPAPRTMPPLAMVIAQPALDATPVPARLDPIPANATPTPIIMFGRDERGRPHAASFVGHETGAVERAADLMGLVSLVAETDTMRDLGAQFAAGRIFPASGKAFVPFTSVRLYDRLLAATGTPDAPRPAKAAGKPAEGATAGEGGTGSGAGGGAAGGGSGGPVGKGPVPKHPTSWDDIGIGSHVLACQGPAEGWFEAVVLYTRSDKTSFTLRWRDWPDEPEIVRARKDLGLMHPNSRAGMA